MGPEALWVKQRGYQAPGCRGLGFLRDAGPRGMQGAGVQGMQRVAGPCGMWVLQKEVVWGQGEWVLWGNVGPRG